MTIEKPCVYLAVVKPDIIETLVKKRDAELAEWREKRKKTAAENAAKEKPKEKEGAASSRESSLLAAPSSTTTVSTPTDPILLYYKCEYTHQPHPPLPL